MLFVGRLVRDKGVFELLDALSIVRRRHACSLVVAGLGPAEDDIRRRVAMMGLGDDVDLRGYVTGDDLDSAYREAALFVLPSYREGFPLVVMEAMDHGLPVVTTPIRGCADHLEPGVNALFAPPRDAESLADALLRLLADPASQARIGAANRLKVREFAPEVVMPRYVEILRSVVGGQEVGEP
jgi:glycosyltransferase involved in cell wall biosynthesis